MGGQKTPLHFMKQTNKHSNLQSHTTVLDQTFKCLFIDTETQWITTFKFIGNSTEIITLHR